MSGLHPLRGLQFDEARLVGFLPSLHNLVFLKHTARGSRDLLDSCGLDVL